MEIYGIRSIIEAIESSKEISKVYLIKSSAQSSLLKSLLSLLEKKSIKYSFVPKERLNKYKIKNFIEYAIIATFTIYIINKFY